jgi:glutathione S-transferase
MLPLLYSFRRCPYAIRARIALCYSNINVELREIRLRDKPQSMLDYSAKGTVPVLVLTDGSVIDESIDIVRWALSHHHNNDRLQALSAKQSQQVRQLIATNDGDFKAGLDRYKYADRYPQQTAEQHRSQAEPFLIALEKALSQNEFLVGGRVSIADIAIFPFIRQFALVDKNWFDQTPHTHLQRWLETGLQSALFNKVMIKYPPWQKGDDAMILSAQ